MGRIIQTFFKAGVGLTSAAVLVLGLQAQAAKGDVLKPAAVLLAQNVETKKEKAAVPAPPPNEAGQSKSMEPAAAPNIRKGKRKIAEPPGAAGTKKIGGQTLRDKEVPEGE